LQSVNISQLSDDDEEEEDRCTFEVKMCTCLNEPLDRSFNRNTHISQVNFNNEEKKKDG